MREFLVAIYAESCSDTELPVQIVCQTTVTARNRAHACHVAWWESPMAQARAAATADLRVPGSIADRDSWCRFNGLIPLCTSLDDGPGVAEFHVSGHPGFDYELRNPFAFDVFFQVALTNNWGNPQPC